MNNLLETHALEKRYPDIHAVRGIDLAIPAGICFGLLGPNGAGKTTSIEMLEGITQPSSGTILYKGEPLGQRFREEAGIMFQATALQDFLNVRETLALFSSLYKYTRPVEELIEECYLQDFLDRDTRKLSGGQRQRLLLAIALLNDPQLVFLDEPTTGLDPQSRRNFWDLVQATKAKGKTVILTTHYMDEAYVLCDEIAIMDHGEIIAEGTPNELLAKHFDDVILELPRAMLPDVDKMDWESAGLRVLTHKERVEIFASDANHALQYLLSKQVNLSRLQIRARNLDDLFLELTGKALRN